MKAEMLGIDVKTGYHTRVLTHEEAVFVGILWVDHVGARRAMPASALAVRYAYGVAGVEIAGNRRAINEWKREVRYMHNHLLEMHHKIPVLSQAGRGGGYWIAENDGEAEAFFWTFRKRGLTGLVKGTRGKQSAVVEVVEQLAFELDELAHGDGLSMPVRGAHAPSMAPAIVDALLTKMTREPEKFSDDIRRLRDKHAAVLMPKATMDAIRAQASGLMDALAGVCG